MVGSQLVTSNPTLFRLSRYQRRLRDWPALVENLLNKMEAGLVDWAL